MPIRTVRLAATAASAALAVVFGVAAFEAVTLTDYSGEEIFQKYCASCHGELGPGDGPVAAGLRTSVPDLTIISRRYGGFPTSLVRDTIDGRGPQIDTHGPRAMPVWGYEFWIEEGGDVDAQREMRDVVEKLVDYVRSIQTDSIAARRD
jgi:mono/diheme cytochrome c family protein